MMGENFDDSDIWRDQGLIARNRQLLSSGEMSDCTFLVGTADCEKQKFSCHKFVLGSASSVFSTMFYGSLTETDVKVTDIQPEHFKQMLEYIYTDNIILNDEISALKIWSAAHKYMIRPLSKKCESFICGKLSAENAYLFLYYARLLDGLKLYRLSNKVITDQTNAVLTSKNFNKIPLTILKLIVQHDVLNISSECQLFKACLRWAETELKDAGKLRTRMNPLLGHIRFRCFTTQEFVDTVCRIEVLTLAERKDILYCITTGSADMPQGFSRSTLARKRFGYEVCINTSYDTAKECKKDENKITFSTNVDVRIVRVDVGELFNQKCKIVIKHGEDKILVDTDQDGKILWLKEPHILCAKKQYTFELEFPGKNVQSKSLPIAKNEFQIGNYRFHTLTVQSEYSPFSSLCFETKL
ncbi:hypothetical protein B566_EDAN006349 [Ephemera danica]|nr:hypothetical protein B566_EDAN006349 [Ephemera danica]